MNLAAWKVPHIRIEFEAHVDSDSDANDPSGKATYHAKSVIAPYFLRKNLGLPDIYWSRWTGPLIFHTMLYQSRWIQNKARTAPIFRRCQPPITCLSLSTLSKRAADKEPKVVD